MSQTLNPTVAATPSAVESATALLSLMAALNGQATDYNIGSQIRTAAEANGSILEQQGISSQAQALQAFAYGAMYLFSILQSSAISASGSVVFSTSPAITGGPAIPQAVAIPSGTIISTPGGIQFYTTSNIILASGTSTVSGYAAAVSPGTSGNVPASGISGTPLTAVGWPLFVVNPNAMAGGANASNQSVSLAQFTARVATLGRASPIAVVNSVIGVSGNPGEYVQFAANYEPWIAAGSGAGSGAAGFTLYIDNGFGTSSATLIANAQAWILGNAAAQQGGYRPIGVPYVVSGAAPIYAVVAVTGVLFPGTLQNSAVQNGIVSGITNYFNALNLAPQAAQVGQIAGAAADAGLASLNSLTVQLFYSGSGSPVSVVSGAIGTRVILGSLNVYVSGGT